MASPSQASRFRLGDSSDDAESRSSDTFPPRSMRLGSFSRLPSRRSPSPMPRSESQPGSDSPIVAKPRNSGGGFKSIMKAFGKKEEETAGHGSPSPHRIDAIVKEKMPSGFQRVLVQIKSKPNLKKRVTVADLRSGGAKFGQHLDFSPYTNRKDSGASINESGEAGVDVPDGHVDTEQRQIAIGHLKEKIKKTEEAIRKEQAVMDGHVNEFSRIDPAEVNKKPKLKSQFEARNNKSKQAIDNLKRKIEKYKARIKTLEQGGGDMTVLKGHVKERLREMKEGIRDTLTGAANLMRRGKHATHEGDLSSLTEMEIGERPVKLVGGSEESAEKGFIIGDIQPVSEISLVGATVADLKERIQGLSEEYIETVKRIDEAKLVQVKAMKDMEEKFGRDFREVRAENEALKAKLEKEVVLREGVECHYQELGALHQDLQTELSQLQERLGLLEYRTGEHFAETDEKMGSLDLKLSQLQHDRSQSEDDFLLNQSNNSSLYTRVFVAKPLSFLLNVISGLIALVSGLLSPFNLCLKGKRRWAWLLGTAFAVLFLILIYF